MSVYRKPAEPRGMGRARVIARAVDPPLDPAIDAAQARHEAAKLIAAQMRENASEEERATRVPHVAQGIVDLLAWLLG